jgi:uncharacterized protein
MDTNPSLVSNRVGRCFGAIMDHPRWGLAGLIVITAIAIGGYLDPDWPARLRASWGPAISHPSDEPSQEPTGNLSAANKSADAVSTSSATKPSRPNRRGPAGGGGANALLVVLSPKLFTPEGSDAFRRVLQNVEELEVVRSVRSLEQAPPLNIFGLAEPILPRSKSTQQRFDVARKKAVSHPLVVGQFLSPDAETTLIEIQYDWLYVQQDSDCTLPILEAATRAAAEFPNAPMQFYVTGDVPLRLMQAENNRNNEVRYQIIGYSMIFIMAVLLFRGLTVVLVVAAAPVLGVFWTLGLVRYFGWEDNPFSFVILPVLLSLVGFTDGVHMMVHIRKCIQSGMDPTTACRRTLELVGMACFLTSLTTAIGMGSLTLAHHEIVREFGWSCVIGVISTWVSVMLVIPLACMTRWSRRLARGAERDFLDRGLSSITPAIHSILRRDRLVSVTAIALTLVLGVLALTLKPDDRESNSFPMGSDPQKAMAHLDQALGGLNACTIQLTWDVDAIPVEEAVSILGELEEHLRSDPLIGHPLSLVTLLNAMPGEGNAVDKLSMAELLPPPMRQRLFPSEGGRAMLSFRCRDLGTAVYQTSFERIEAKLDELATNHPTLKSSLSGRAITRWRNIYQIVTDLVSSLGGAALVIFAVLSIAYRSLRLGLIAIVPNMLPLLVAAGFMVATGMRLEIVSVCCFTICLGIAVDDTIHFLSRYTEEQKLGGTHNQIIERSFQAVGTGMIMTTIVLVGGFSSVLFSDTRDHRIFGALGVVTLVSALLCDLFLLPAMLSYLDRPRNEARE